MIRLTFLYLILVYVTHHSSFGILQLIVLLLKSHYTSEYISGIIKGLTCLFETRRGGGYLSSLLTQMVVAILAGIVVALFSNWLNNR
ncbi:type I toxin-antitoxin system Fst family toxin [Lentilactobacillus kefiri]|uniref:type I toxin-antitoxin system Fst family toxin n=1 Tax=Lentilactobacillus kefiri TaxID=33962 RepID=UPI003341AEDE